VRIYELHIGWAESANERRCLRWELLACEEVLGVFSTDREDRLVVLFTGTRHDFRVWARSFEPPTQWLTTTTEGAFR
jgi:hypothetical protein